METNKQITNECIMLSKKAHGTPYFKVMILGNTGIYYASPIYQHKDYNKTRLFDITDETLKLMMYFNSKFNLKN